MNVDLIIAMAMVSGLSLRLDGEELVVRPRSALTVELKELLLTNKSEIVSALRDTEVPVGTFLDNGRRWVPPRERAGWCPCDAGRIWDEHSGLCRICHIAVYGQKIRMPRGMIDAAREDRS